MSYKSVSGVVMDGMEKRREPSKHYIYVIKAKYTDGTEQTLFRRYNQFFDFQTTLLDMFPEEGGITGNRTIPFLPGKKLFGRSHVRDVAMKRVQPLAAYMEALLHLPPKISDCELLRAFFHPLESDLNPPSAVGVKRDNSEALEKQRKTAKAMVNFDVSSPMQLEQFRAVSSYKATNKTEMTLEEDVVYDVIEKDDNGWWFVSKGPVQGWAPATFLEPVQIAAAIPAVSEPAPKLAPLPAPIQAVTRKQETAIDIVKKVVPIEKAKAAINQYANTSNGSSSSSSSSGGGKQYADPAEKVYDSGKDWYVATEDFAGENDEEISFSKGDVVEVLDKDPNGWWFVALEGEEGWAPSTYLKPKSKSASGAKGASKSGTSTPQYSNLPNTTATPVVKVPASAKGTTDTYSNPIANGTNSNVVGISSAAAAAAAKLTPAGAATPKPAAAAAAPKPAVAAAPKPAAAAAPKPAVVPKPAVAAAPKPAAAAAPPKPAGAVAPKPAGAVAPKPAGAIAPKPAAAASSGYATPGAAAGGLRPTAAPKPSVAVRPGGVAGLRPTGAPK
ncbi:hypothetical protein CAOG_01712 [Capsaspora owczarzaki ATCC 30864]|nr:hypothetical protein CAOG_01712 [Capsaspora owczarzaki ATCC 30864]|eukprot:XP_004364580.1 hypothetical protein CAOG_01712 [Capsaspora owczarzaki ATCC 30864]